MKKIAKNDKGITLVALVITIVVILILASVATYSGIDVIKSSEFTRFSAELKIMQTQVNNLYEKWKSNEKINEKEILRLGEEIQTSSQVQQQANKIFTEENAGITDQTGYRYFSAQTIKDLKIEGVEQDFFVNVQTRSVVSYNGIEYKDKKYYTPEQIGVYNIDYKENVAKPTFDINIDMLAQNEYKVIISNIQYEGYINKWKVRYQKEKDDYWNTSEELNFTIKESGKYNIYIQNGEIESEHITKQIGYISDKQILHYDGIVNTRKGHNLETTIWEDLSGNNNDADLYDCIINENNLEFNGSSSYGKLPTNALGNYGASTIEIVMEPTIDEAVVLTDNSNISNRGIGYNTNSLFTWIGLGSDVSQYFLSSKTVNEEKHIYTVLYDGVDYNNTIAYQDNIKLSKSSNNDGYSNNSAYPIIGKREYSAGGEWNFKGKIYSVQIYNKKLSEEEIKINYEINKDRFNIK